MKSPVQGKDAVNRRDSARHPVMVLEVKGKTFDKVFVAYADNIGLGGLRMASSQSLKVGDRFPIEFVMPDAVTSVACSCEVAWKKEIGYNRDGIGIRFVDLSSKAKTVIGKWIDQQNQGK